MLFAYITLIFILLIILNLLLLKFSCNKTTTKITNKKYIFLNSEIEQKTEIPSKKAS